MRPLVPIKKPSINVKSRNFVINKPNKIQEGFESRQISNKRGIRKILSPEPITKLPFYTVKRGLGGNIGWGINNDRHRILNQTQLDFSDAAR